MKNFNDIFSLFGIDSNKTKKETKPNSPPDNFVDDKNKAIADLTLQDETVDLASYIDKRRADVKKEKNEELYALEEERIENLSKNYDVSSINAQSIALELGNSKVINSVVLGFASKSIGFDKDEWLKVIESTVPPKTIEINKNAFVKGYEA